MAAAAARSSAVVAVDTGNDCAEMDAEAEADNADNDCIDSDDAKDAVEVGDVSVATETLVVLGAAAADAGGCCLPSRFI